MNPAVRGLRLLVLLILLAAALATMGLVLARRPYRGYPGDSVRFEIPLGTPTVRIFSMLADRGVVRSALLATAYYRIFRHGAPLKAGEYEFREPRNVDQVIDILVRGEVVKHVVVVPEGLTAIETFRLFWQQGISTEEGFRRAVRDAEILPGLTQGTSDIEGFLFPNTYVVTRSTTAREVITLMVNNFRRHFTPEMREKAEKLRLTPRQAVTLASMIEKETALPSERAVVAAVYLNRLRKHMLLQCDPTVIYSLERGGKWTGRLHRSELLYDSPYNTYLYPGLPPGPICNPGAAALAAAVNPAHVDYLYFVAKGDGTHAFSRTYSEHLRMVQLYQRSVEEDNGAAGTAHRKP
jgi:peptidoglycan lytic transglycosylase G